MTPFLKTATDLVDDCLQDYRIQSGMRMGLMNRIAKALREQYKAGMLMAAEIVENRGSYKGIYTAIDPDITTLAIRTEAEKEEMK